LNEVVLLEINDFVWKFPSKRKKERKTKRQRWRNNHFQLNLKLFSCEPKIRLRENVRKNRIQIDRRKHEKAINTCYSICLEFCFTHFKHLIVKNKLFSFKYVKVVSIHYQVQANRIFVQGLCAADHSSLNNFNFNLKKNYFQAKCLDNDSLRFCVLHIPNR
jgi:hypothetical protein